MSSYPARKKIDAMASAVGVPTRHPGETKSASLRRILRSVRGSDTRDPDLADTLFPEAAPEVSGALSAYLGQKDVWSEDGGVPISALEALGFDVVIDEVLSAPGETGGSEFKEGRYTLLVKDQVLVCVEMYRRRSGAWNLNSMNASFVLAGESPDVQIRRDMGSVSSRPQHRCSFWFDGRGQFSDSFWALGIGMTGVSGSDVHKFSRTGGEGSFVPPSGLGGQDRKGLFTEFVSRRFSELVSNPASHRSRLVIPSEQAEIKTLRAAEVDPLMVTVGRRVYLLPPQVRRLILADPWVGEATSAYERASEMGIRIYPDLPHPDPQASPFSRRESSPIGGDLFEGEGRRRHRRR